MGSIPSTVETKQLWVSENRSSSSPSSNTRRDTHTKWPLYQIEWGSAAWWPGAGLAGMLPWIWSLTPQHLSRQTGLLILLKANRSSCMVVTFRWKFDYCLIWRAIWSTDPQLSHWCWSWVFLLTKWLSSHTSAWMIQVCPNSLCQSAHTLTATCRGLYAVD